jgi:hypothetical protein
MGSALDQSLWKPVEWRVVGSVRNKFVAPARGSPTEFPGNLFTKDADEYERKQWSQHTSSRKIAQIEPGG